MNIGKNNFDDETGVEFFKSLEKLHVEKIYCHKNNFGLQTYQTIKDFILTNSSIQMIGCADNQMVPQMLPELEDAFGLSENKEIYVMGKKFVSVTKKCKTNTKSAKIRKLFFTIVKNIFYLFADL